MSRSFSSFTISDSQYTKQQMLNWASQFNICAFLDNHHYNLAHHSIEALVAVGATRSVEASAGNAFAQLKTFFEESKDWVFGHLAYDLKNEVESVSSSHPDGIRFPDLFFFVPEIILQLNGDRLDIHSSNIPPKDIFAQVISSEPINDPASKAPSIKHRFSKEDYITTVRHLQKHILRGDCYEINFCQEFYSDEVTINPVKIYRSLSKASPNPYSAFYRLNDRYLLCASPERYLRKKGRQLISQPIKGTWHRDFISKKEDEKNRDRLFNSQKDRAENVMVVDLVRNDLSKVCEKGSVKVDELFGIYSFPQVHQMVSTISGELKNDKHWVEAIRASFPMGSMTGAPKKKVMELIERYEKTRRGIFSGAIGYIQPDGDFDFNVVIRSLLYNSTNQYLSFQAGSGITFYSDAGKEYEECLLKADAIKKVLAGQAE